jgi:peptide/nickel transport system substrate-binding protein
VLITAVLFAGGKQEGAGESAEMAAPTAGNESPMLAEQVNAGELPPLEERIPANPLVIEPVEQVGQYGGEIFLAATNPRGFGTDLHVTGFEPPLALNPDSTVGPNVVESWESSDEARVWTLYLREGIRWSDGEPFDADDIVYWWEDEVNNPDLIESIYISEFRGMELTKVDDYTIRVELADSAPLFRYTLAKQWGYLGKWWRPQHALEDFNPKYRDKDELMSEAEEEGYDTIRDYYMSQAGWSAKPVHVDTPTLIAYDLVETSPDVWIWERNPYYWKVDTEGNQLPYIDRVVVRRIENVETIQGQVVSGQVDIEVWTNSLENYPLYRESEEAGNFRTLLWETARGSEVNYMPNQTTKDDALRQIFQNADFRRALSLAVNREEINEQLYFGRAVPRQYTLHPSSRYFQEEWAESYAEYDPDRANQLLDDMGLTERDGEGFRLMPNGERLAFTIQYWPEEPATKTPMSQLVKEYWAEIGVDITLQPQDRSLNSQRAEANEIQMNIWHGGGTTDSQWLLTTQPPLPATIGWATEWSVWYFSDGEEGEEPPADLIEYFRLGEELQTTTDEERRAEIAEILWQAQADQIWHIGTVGMAPYPIIVSESLRNVPEEAIWSGDTLWLHPYHPEQFYLQQ